MVCLTELGTSVGLTKGPTRWGNIVGNDCFAITCCNLERQSLAIKIIVALPILTPISRHWHPP